MIENALYRTWQPFSRLETNGTRPSIWRTALVLFITTYSSLSRSLFLSIFLMYDGYKSLNGCWSAYRIDVLDLSKLPSSVFLSFAAAPFKDRNEEYHGKVYTEGLMSPMRWILTHSSRRFSAAFACQNGRILTKLSFTSPCKRGNLPRFQ